MAMACPFDVIHLLSYNVCMYVHVRMHGNTFLAFRIVAALHGYLICNLNLQCNIYLMRMHYYFYNQLVSYSQVST